MSSGNRSTHRPPLGAHRLLGQGAGSALLRPNGEIDWWCPNEFHATPALWSLLDADGGASKWLDVELATWDGHPAGPTAHSLLRRGNDRIETWDGLLTFGESTLLIRLVRGDGEDKVLRHQLRSGGFDGAWHRWEASGSGVRTTDLYVVGAGRHSIEAEGRRVVTEIELHGTRWSGVIIGAGPVVEASIAECIEWMEAAEADEAKFLQCVQLPHDHPSRAFDALRVLRALTDPVTGAPVASATTSLPEAPGGERQFDYRYTWLRDSGHAAATAALLGRTTASSDYLDFIGDLLDRYGAKITPVTTTRGDPTPSEREVFGVAGWAGSLPVRVGNEASGQFQMDSLATVLEAMAVHMHSGGRMTTQRWQTVETLAGMLVDAPFGASSGIWELREPKRLVTEELARWIGLDKAIRMQRIFRPLRRRPNWHAARAAARERVESMLDEDTGMLAQSFDGPFVADGATLLACTNGFYKRRSKQSRRLALATIAALEEGSFMRRYQAGTDDFDSVEGAFIPTSWLAVSALVAAGELDAAQRRVDDMCSHLPPLQSEEWWVENDEGLGNTPLLWSHTEGARALYNLHVARLRRRYTPVGLALWRFGRYLRLRRAL